MLEAMKKASVIAKQLPDGSEHFKQIHVICDFVRILVW